MNTTKTTTWMTLVWTIVTTAFPTGQFTKKELMEKGSEAFTTNYPNNKNHQASVSTQLTKLVKEGKLVRVAKGVYQITETTEEVSDTEQLNLF
jgi:ribosomal protein S17E